MKRIEIQYQEFYLFDKKFITKISLHLKKS
jgi:hypothetical protein